ncbi:MAG: Phosphoesterase, PA-phosphatase related protein [Myxococcaceae bacterium]|nr:Phosphoesterase, PA-phosphatase related protein [Myxococcaceae bacterium]
MIAFDVRVFRWLHQSFSEGGWLALMCVLTVIGSGWGALLILPLFASPRTRRFAGSLSAVLGVTAVIVFALKAIIQRRRPYLVLDGVRALVFEAPTDFSCPSGHAAGSFAFATFVAVVLVRHAMRQPKKKKRRIILATVALVVALGVAMSRCVLGVHFPIDVFAGAIVGSALGTMGARIHLERVAHDAPK